MFKLCAAVLIAGTLAGRQAVAQVEYRNLDGGRPVRIEDATPTERHGLDVDLTTLRLDRLSLNRTRLQIEPRFAYGILPNTEVSLRIPVFFREQGQSPRSGISGMGIGLMREIHIESLDVPALAYAGEAFLPVGSTRTRAAYSAKAVITKSFSAGRLHLNAGYGTYSVRLRPALVVTPCQSDPANPCPIGPELPPIDGPCNIVSDGAFPQLRAFCAAQPSQVSAQAVGPIVTNKHWLAGVAADKAFPLKSLLIVADVFAERFEGIGRSTDWTAEVGVRRQVTPWLVMDGALGRHYLGTSLSSFVTFGTTVTHALVFRRPR